MKIPIPYEEKLKAISYSNLRNIVARRNKVARGDGGVDFV